MNGECARMAYDSEHLQRLSFHLSRQTLNTKRIENTKHHAQTQMFRLECRAFHTMSMCVECRTVGSEGSCHHRPPSAAPDVPCIGGLLRGRFPIAAPPEAGMLESELIAIT